VTVPTISDVVSWACRNEAAQRNRSGRRRNFRVLGKLKNEVGGFELARR
jgi:hypothetical protein